MKPHRTWDTKDPTLDANGYKLKQPQWDKLARAQARRLRPIDPTYLQWDKLERMVSKNAFGLGGSIADVIEARHTTLDLGELGVVACVRLVAYVEYEAEGKGELGEGQHLSDGIRITVYRDPRRPSSIKATLAL